VAECFFCLEDCKLTKAHLFQKRLREVLQTHSDSMYLSASSAAHRGVNRALSFPGDMREANVTSLCGDCNAIWMQRLEIDAAPVFADLIGGERVPPPPEMFALARWSVVFAALSSELFRDIEMPREQRRAIRFANGHPERFSTYAVWTTDWLHSVESDLYRGVSATGGVHWASLLHAGGAILISATPALLGRVPRVLEDAGVRSTLGFIGESAVYVPEDFQVSMQTDGRPSHVTMRDLGPRLVGGGGSFTETSTGTQVLDLSRGLEMNDIEMSFEFRGRLVDPRQLRGGRASGRPDGRTRTPSRSAAVQAHADHRPRRQSSAPAASAIHR